MSVNISNQPSEKKVFAPANNTLICPVCSQPLKRSEKQLSCENNHQYDVAKQGYVNLLQPQYKKSKQPGDSQEMVEARYQFLDEGYYEPISNRLNEALSLYLTSHKKDTHETYITDAGSGEGYYTHRLQESLTQEHRESLTQQHREHLAIPSNIIGFDISQRAVKAACRRSKSIQWITATSSHIPIADHSQDAVLCLFSRIVPDEFSRILKSDGILYVASTGPTHLIELRNLLYKDVKQSAYNPTPTLSGRFTALDEPYSSNIQYKININSRQAISNLLLMTPHYWRATEAAKAAILAMDHISVSIDIRLTGYRLCS